MFDYRKGTPGRLLFTESLGHHPWVQGRTVYRGSYTYGTNDHIGQDSYALDFMIGQGTGGPTGHTKDVRAVASGTVVWTGWFDQNNQTNNTLHCYGYSVAIQHTYVDTSGNHYTSFYAHLASIDPSITLGAPVSQGQVLGIEGNTGSGLTGCVANMPEHLHFVLYASPSSVSTITNNGANPPSGNANPANGTVTIEAVVPEPFMGQDGEGQPTTYENFEWFAGPMIAGGTLATAAANPGGTWNTGATPDGAQLAYDQPIQFSVHVTDTVNIAEVHFTVDYHPTVNNQTTSWNYPDAGFMNPVAFPSDAIWRILVVCKPGPPATCKSAQNAGGGSATWTGTATAADITFSWYPAREVGSNNLEIPSLVNWLPGAYPAQTPYTTASIGACISFDVFDTAGVENLAPNGVNCVNGGYTVGSKAPAPAPKLSLGQLFHAPPSTSDPSHLITVNPAPSGTACPPNGTWAGPIVLSQDYYLNKFYTGQTDSSNNCLYFTASITLESYVLPPGTYIIPSDITVDNDTTLTIPSGTTLYLTGNIYVKGTLSVQAGAQLVFASGNYGVQVQGGTLNMAGTAAQPIVLTTNASPLAAGSWTGIIFTPAGSVPAGGTLSYVQVLDAGATFAFGGNCIDSGTCYNAGIWINGAGTAPSLDHVTVDHSYSNGIEVVNGAAPTMSALTLTANGVGTQPGNALQYDFPPPDLSGVSGLSASGNTQNSLTIGGGTISSAGMWPNVGIPLRLTGTITLTTGANLTLGNGLNIAQASGGFLVQGAQATGAQLTIGQGVAIGQLNGSIQVDPGNSLTVGAGTSITFVPGNNSIWTRAGSMAFNGTAAQPITLTSGRSIPALGDWQGVVYTTYNSTPSTGSMSYVQVSYAGRTWGSCSSCWNTGIQLNGSSPTVSNVTIDHSLGNDVEVVGGVQPVLRANNFGAVPAGRYGVSYDNWTSGQPTLDATYSWWGDPSGPTVNSNPGGAGTPVTAGVTYSPWTFGPVGTPSLLLAPATGPAGSTVSVSGSGFGPSESVSVIWNCSTNPCTGGTALGTASTDAGGNFSGFNVQIPGSATAGVYSIVGIGGTSGDVGTALFTVPGSGVMFNRDGVAITVTPTTAPPSQVVTLTNTGTRSVSWSAASLPPWLSIRPSSGMLAQGASQQLVLTFNASKLAASGTYATMLRLTNTVTGVGAVVLPVTVHVLDLAPKWAFSATRTQAIPMHWSVQLSNPLEGTAHVTITYRAGTSLTKAGVYVLKPHSTTSISLTLDMPPSISGVQIVVSSYQPIVAEAVASHQTSAPIGERGNMR